MGVIYLAGGLNEKGLRGLGFNGSMTFEGLNCVDISLNSVCPLE